LFLFSDGLVNQGEKNKDKILSNVANLYEKSSIQVSAFGIGADFDEELMKGIAEKGIGAYFFIDNADSIPTFVEFALKFIQQMVGVDATLKVRGVNSGLAKKFHGGHDLLKGAKLGDLRADNVRTLMVKMEVSPRAEIESEKIMECELTYTKSGQPMVVSQALWVNFTNNSEEVVENEHPEVKVWTVLQKSAKIDKALIGAMESDNAEESIKLQKKQISLLEEVVEIDMEKLAGRNKITELLEKAKNELEKLEQEGVTKNAQKEAHHRYYLVRRG